MIAVVKELICLCFPLDRLQRFPLLHPLLKKGEDAGRGGEGRLQQATRSGCCIHPGRWLSCAEGAAASTAGGPSRGHVRRGGGPRRERRWGEGRRPRAAGFVGEGGGGGAEVGRKTATAWGFQPLEEAAEERELAAC
jgi:hypothetical protein